MGHRKVASLKEVRRAKLFLSLIGAHTLNNQLILAVVAWMRVEGSNFDVYRFARKVINRSTWESYNFTPMVIPGGLPPEEKELIRQYNEEGEAKEARINARRKERARWYKLILAAARHDQAGDFLYAVALSNWDAHHYGGYSDGVIDTRENRLLQTYSRFTGLTLTPPTTEKEPKATKLPKVPKQLRAPLYQSPYLDPQGVRRFYLERHSVPPKS